MPNLTYAQRAQQTKQPVAKKLLEIMESKQTNLCVAADVTTKAELLALAKEVGPHICILKTHIDIIKDFDKYLIPKLRELAEEHKFLIFEDRKFADIGNTGELQYSGGIYEIASWADIINAHSVSGPGIISSLQKAAGNNECALLLLAQMSSKDNLLTPSYTKKTVQWGLENKKFVMGFISMGNVTHDPDMLCMTPGIQFNNKTDGKGQQYVEPFEAINKGSDVIIVGRGIYEAKDKAETASKYKEAGWQAYQERLKFVEPSYLDSCRNLLFSTTGVVSSLATLGAATLYANSDAISEMINSSNEKLKI